MEETPSRSSLKQDDFRKLLLTPRTLSKSDAPKSFAAPPTPRQSGQPKSKKFKKEEEEDAKDDARYRDRAKERREGNLGEYAESHQILQTIGSGESVNYAQSKYLGGDMEHTHLVKGLDYALLNKQRSEVTKENEEQDLNFGEDNSVSFEVLCNHPMARKIMDILFTPKTKTKNEQFGPGRMAFRFELDEEYGSDLPTTLIRSKADIADFQSKHVVVDDVVMTKVSQIMLGVRQGTRSVPASKFKKPEVVQKSPKLEIKKIKRNVPMDDIFPDAGTYKYDEDDDSQVPTKVEKMENKERDVEMDERPLLGPSRNPDEESEEMSQMSIGDLVKTVVQTARVRDNRAQEMAPKATAAEKAQSSITEYDMGLGVYGSFSIGSSKFFENKKESRKKNGKGPKDKDLGKIEKILADKFKKPDLIKH